MNLNKVFLCGRICRKPELRVTPSGTQVCTFSLAINRVWKDKSGAKQEQADFQNVVTFGKIAETIAQYCDQGDELFVEGRIQTRSWENKDDGKKRYATEVIAEGFQFGAKKRGQEAPGQSEYQKPANRAAGGYDDGQGQGQPQPGPEDDPGDIDIKNIPY